MVNRCYDWEKANILLGRNAHVTALLGRPKILTNHQHLNCQTYSNPYSHHRDGQSQSLRARFKPGLSPARQKKLSPGEVEPQVKVLATPVEQKTRLGCNPSGSDCLVPSLSK